MKRSKSSASATFTVVAACAIASSVARADTPAPPSGDNAVIVRMSESCRGLNAAGRYGESLSVCLAAAEAYHQAQAAQNPPSWFLVYAQANMLAFAAADRAGLNQHADALQMALSAHRMLSYVARSYDLLTSDRQRVVGLATELVTFEGVEAATLRGGRAAAPAAPQPVGPAAPVARPNGGATGAIRRPVPYVRPEAPAATATSNVPPWRVNGLPKALATSTPAHDPNATPGGPSAADIPDGVPTPFAIPGATSPSTATTSVPVPAPSPTSVPYSGVLPSPDPFATAVPLATPTTGKPSASPSVAPSATPR